MGATETASAAETAAASAAGTSAAAGTAAASAAGTSAVSSAAGAAAEAEGILEVDNLAFSFDGSGGARVFSGVSFSLRPGDIFTVLGPNGVGKSTLFNCICGFLKPVEGCVRVFGKPTGEYSQNELARRLAYDPQMQNFAFDYKVRDYLVMGRTPYVKPLARPGVEDYRVVERVIADLGIEALGDKSMRQISGGERQQVQIARALVQEPRILMLDEPTNHLDYGNQLKVLGLISRLAKSRDMVLILTSHVPDHAILLGGKTGILERGGKMTVGPVGRIVTEETLRRIYNTNLHLVDIECIGRKACVAGGLA